MRDDVATTGYVEHLHNIDDCARQSALYEQPHNMRLRVHSRRENCVSAHPTQCELSHSVSAHGQATTSASTGECIIWREYYTHQELRVNFSA
jgi:hypothetical protein